MISSDSVWFLSHNGTPFSTNIVDNPDSENDVKWFPEEVIHECETKALRDIASTANAVFGIDDEGALYIYQIPTLISIRNKIAIYENQRWYPVIGWGKTLPTDRATITDKDGNNIRKGELEEPGSGWRWEEPWSVQYDPRHDEQGWEYSLNFGLGGWRNSQGLGCFVRRRMLKRYMKYAGIGRWVKVCSRSLTSIAICLGTNPDSFALVGVDTAGKVHRLEGISIDHIHGSGWTTIDKIVSPDGEDEDIVFLAASPEIHSLFAVTWDGKVYCKNGTEGVWNSFPTPLGLPSTSLAISTDSLWLATADGRMWFHRIQIDVRKKVIQTKGITEKTYVECGEMMNRPCLSKSGQLLCVSGSKVLFRDGISLNEPSGKRFQEVIQRIDGDFEDLCWSKICTVGSFPSIPQYWYKDISLKRSQLLYRNCSWRNTILSRLDEQDEKCWSAFNKLTELSISESEEIEETEQDSVNKTGKCRLRTHLKTTVDGIECKTVLTSDQLHISGVKTNKTIKIGEIDHLRPGYVRFTLEFVIEVRHKRDYFYLCFNAENERDGWYEALEKLYHQHLKTVFGASQLLGWSIGAWFNLFYHFKVPTEKEEKSTRRRNSSPDNWTHVKRSDEKELGVKSVFVPGRFASVSSGADGIVWMLNETGDAYCIQPEWKPLDGHNYSNIQEDSVIEELDEWQRYLFLRGFVPLSAGCKEANAWDSRYGPVKGKYSRLPGKAWSWIDAEWQLKKEENEGWTYYVKPGEEPVDQKKSKFRMRTWIRRAKFSLKGPFIRIQAPALKEVHVQKQTADRILVWGVTTRGEILLRQGVSKDKPDGTIWKQVYTDSPVNRIHVESPTRVWLVSQSGRLLYRQCDDQADMECVDWYEYSSPKMDYLDMKKITAIFVRNECIWLSDESALAVTKIGSKTAHSIELGFSVQLTDIDSRGRVYWCNHEGVKRLDSFSVLQSSSRKKTSGGILTQAETTELLMGQCIGFSINC